MKKLNEKLIIICGILYLSGLVTGILWTRGIDRDRMSIGPYKLPDGYMSWPMEFDSIRLGVTGVFFTNPKLGNKPTQ